MGDRTVVSSTVVIAPLTEFVELTRGQRSASRRAHSEGREEHCSSL